MAQDLVNIGAAPNDGTGDPARSAFNKVNNNAIDAESRLQNLESQGLQDKYEIESAIETKDANGPVKISAGETVPALTVEHNPVLPANSLESGSIWTDSDGEFFSYDDTRSKFLSVYKTPLIWTDNGNNDNNYLRDGNIISATSGWRVPFDCTIVQIIANGENNLTKGFELRSNSGGAFASIQAFSLSSGFFNNENLNIDVDQGVELKCWVTGVGIPVNDPRVTVYIKKRGV